MLEHLNQKLLQPAQVVMKILAAALQIDDRIPDQLSWPMISCLAPAINWEQRMRQVRSAEEAGLVRRAANCVNRLMFEKKQFVSGGSIGALFREDFFLQGQRIRKIHAAEPAHTQRVLVP